VIGRVIALALMVLGVSGCNLFGPDPRAASLPPVFGARLTDGQLRLWTGTPCAEVSRVTIYFSPGGAELVLEPPAGRWADVEYLALDGPYPQLNVAAPLPAGFDWRTAEQVDLWLDSPKGVGSTPTNLAEIVEGSDRHPDDTYYFQGIGWLNSGQVAERNGTSLLTVCTPDPAKEPSLPSTFGARVTDGRLLLWTGSPCAETNGVTLIFKPDDSLPEEFALTMYAPTGSAVDFDRLTLGDTPSGMQVDQTLPNQFDWRAMQSLTLQLHRPELHRDATLPLRAVLDESAHHPADTYYFEGVGWLNPDQVADQIGKTFLGPCTPDPAK